jgi:hypothetical protein
MSKNNLNILWAIPFHFPLVFFSAKERFRAFFKTYFKVVAFWYGGLLLVWALLPQPLHKALVPLVLAMLLRSFYLSYFLRPKKKRIS